MKKAIICTTLLLLVIAGCRNTPVNEWPVLKGDYLGQQLSGDQPAIFAPGIVSTDMYERDVAITPDGNEIYYSIFTGSWNTIMVTRRINGVWQEPVVAEFARDTLRYFAEPALSSDGSRIFFLSTKKSWKEQDIWMAERNRDGEWGNAAKLPDNINALSEYFPSLTNDGTMYFSRSEDKTGSSRVFRSRLINGVYADPEVLPPPVNGKRVGR